MIIEAIVYESLTGFTKKYAELLAEATGLKAYDRKNNASGLKKGTSIIFFGWLMAGGVKGYKKALRKYNISALAGVGAASPSEKAANDIIARYKIIDMPVFYLQGGLDMNKLRGLYKIMMKNVSKSTTAAVEKKETPTEEELLMQDLAKNGGDFVCAENLKDIVSWVNGDYRDNA